MDSIPFLLGSTNYGTYIFTSKGLHPKKIKVDTLSMSEMESDSGTTHEIETSSPCFSKERK
jgi:hypothetical protein